MKRLFVGNLPYNQCTDAALRAIFAGFTVESTHVVNDRETSRPRGFCFVELGSPDEAARAVESLDGQEIDGRVIGVRIAEDKKKSAGSRDDRRSRGRRDDSGWR